MKRAIVALFATLAFVFCGPPHAFAAVTQHMSGTSLPNGWTCPAHAGNGITAMNGTIVAGSGGSATAGVSGEDWMEFKTAANADAALCYRTTAVDFSTSKIYRFIFRQSTAVNAFYVWLSEDVPAVGALNAVFGTAGKALMRIEVQNSGVNIGVSRYANDASRTRTQWNTGTAAWAAPAVNASTITTGTYSDVRLEIDGPNRRWRVHVIGQTGTANTPDASMHQVALTDWVNFSFHEGGTVFCNPTCGTTYLTFGEPLNDAATTTAFVELYEEFDGTKKNMWTNGRNAGGTWAIHQNYGYPDANGVYRFVPLDRTSTALAVGSAGQWDETQVKDPYVIKDGTNYIMMYGGSNATGFQVGCASASSEDGPWTKCPNNPIQPRSAGTTRDQTLNPTLIKDEGEPDAAKRWKMIFVGADTSSPLKFNVFVSYCSQPPTHTSCDTSAEWSAPVLLVAPGAAAAIDEIGWGRVLPMRIGTTNYLFGGVRNVTAGSANARQESYATTSDRWLTQGNMTKSGVVTNGALSSNCSTTTTAAITTPGSRTFTVASTTGCNRDDMVVTDDDATTGNYHVNRILRVASATSLIMYHNEDSLASGALVRSPNAFQQIDVGPILAYVGGYVKYATCFGSMGGGGSTFDAYAEQTCAWTSSSPLGPWTLYGLSTPVVPLSSFSRGASNENPSFVNLPIPALTGGSGAGVQVAPPTLIRTFPKSF